MRPRVPRPQVPRPRPATPGPPVPPRTPRTLRTASLLAGGALLLVAAFAPVAAAQPASEPSAPPADAPGLFAGQAVAFGVHDVVDSSPPLTPVNELISDYAPEGVSTLDSAGTADALASTLDARGAANLPAFLCLAGAPCPAGFPPANPLDAHASYPDQPTASGLVSYVGQPLSVDSLLGFTPGAVTAAASLGGVATQASLTDASTAAGIPGLVTSSLPAPPLPGTPAITARTVSATTAQYFLPSGAFVVRAQSQASDVTVAGLLQVAALDTTVTTVLDGVHPPVTTARTVLTGALLAGIPVSIGAGGVQLAGVSDHGTVLRTLAGGATAVESASQAAVALLNAGTELAHVGIRGGLHGITVAAVQVAQGNAGVVAQAGGLSVSFQLTPSGLPALSVPAPPPPVCAETDPIFSAAGAPLSLCALPGADLNATYTGTVSLAGAGVAAQAGPAPANLTVAPPAAGSGSAGGGQLAAAPATGSGAAAPALPLGGPAGLAASRCAAASRGCGEPAAAVPVPRVASGGGLPPPVRVTLLLAGMTMAAGGSLLGRLRRFPARLPAG